MNQAEARDFRNTPEGGFGVATNAIKISVSLPISLDQQLEQYIEQVGGIKSRVIQKSLKEFLDQKMSPAKRKQLKAG
ncbi:MAG: ribbon-helix-helix domain-containing protein [Leptospira sp.]|nr:ribbon-helix-helix domain-containing protein [Leptospira sp.]